MSTYWYDRDVKERLRGLDWAPIVYTSATSGQRIERQVCYSVTLQCLAFYASENVVTYVVEFIGNLTTALYFVLTTMAL
jgi:hypothetical protein